MNNKINPNSNKVSMFYGRARRLALAKGIAIVVVGCIIVGILLSIIFGEAKEEEGNVNYKFLRTYFSEKGYSCGPLQYSGNSCTYNANGTKYVFTRYDDGFEYTVKTKSYILNMMHRLGEEDYISFITTNEAFIEFRNNTYMCEFEDDILTSLEHCKTTDGKELTIASYLGIIEQAQEEVENIITASGYYRDSLMNDYEWNLKS